MSEAEQGPSPTEQAWAIVEAMVRMVNGHSPDERVSIEISTDPPLVGQLVERLAAIAAVQMLEADDPYAHLVTIKQLVAEHATAVTEALVSDDALAEFRATARARNALCRRRPANIADLRTSPTCEHRRHTTFR